MGRVSMFDVATQIEGRLSDGPKCFGCRAGTRYAITVPVPSARNVANTYHVCPVCDWPPGMKINGVRTLEAYYENRKE